MITLRIEHLKIGYNAIFSRGDFVSQYDFSRANTFISKKLIDLNQVLLLVVISDLESGE